MTLLLRQICLYLPFIVLFQRIKFVIILIRDEFFDLVALAHRRCNLLFACRLRIESGNGIEIRA